MIKVIIWDFRGVNVAWGHASMSVDGGEPPGGIYISWWPSRDNRQPKFPKAGGLLRQVYSVQAIMGRTYDDDVQGEDNKPPDHVIRLNGLDETAIKTWWHDLLQSSDTIWSSLGQNCATTVARALKAGGGDDMTTGFGGWWDSWNVVWTPNDVLDYALAIQRGIASRKV
jgi:hypothetical protein